MPFPLSKKSAKLFDYFCVFKGFFMIAKTVALFIDADNITSEHHHNIINTAKKYGMLTVKRVYTNWTKTHVDNWKTPCIQYGLSAIQQFDHLSGKNSSDMAVCVDVMETLFNKNIDVFCLVSSDSDFTPVCLKLQEYGKTVIGIGNQNASKSLVNACHEFHYLVKKEQVVPPVVAKPVDNHDKKHRPNPNNDQKLITTITKIIQEHGKNGELHTAKLGQLIRLQHPNFNPTFYGYAKIGELLRAMGEFDVFNKNSTQFIKIHQAKAVSLPYDSTLTSAVQSTLSAEALIKDTVLTNALSNAIAIHQDTDGWALVSDVQAYLHGTFGIISQNYGYPSVLDILKNLSTLCNIKKTRQRPPCPRQTHPQ